MSKYQDLVGQDDWLPALDGHAWTFGDGILRKQILEDVQLRSSVAQAARHVMAAVSPGLVRRIRPGDFLVAGENFATDVTEPIVPAALRKAGIGAVIARSFGAAFERNSILAGLPVVVVEETAAIKRGDRLRVDVEAHVVANKSSGDRYVIRNLDETAVATLRRTS